MDNQPARIALIDHVAGGIAAAMSGRSPGEPGEVELRGRSAVAAIMEFQPLDAIEAMLAGHCVIFHALILEITAGMIPGQDEAARRATLGSLSAMDRAFGANLTRLERYRARQEKARGLDAGGNRAKAVAPRRDVAPEAEAMPVEAGAGRTDPGDDAAPAAIPDDVDIVARLAGLNRQARREFGRQARKLTALARDDGGARRSGAGSRLG
jgi:hypothetical protein